MQTQTTTTLHPEVTEANLHHNYFHLDRNTALRYYLQQAHKGHGLYNRPHPNGQRLYRHGTKPRGFHDYQNLQWDPSIYRGRTFRDFREKNLAPYSTVLNLSKLCGTRTKARKKIVNKDGVPLKLKERGLPRLKVGGILRPTTDDIIFEETSGRNRHKQDESIKEMEPFIVEQYVIPEYKEMGTSPDEPADGENNPIKRYCPIAIGRSKSAQADICVIGSDNDTIQPIVSTVGSKVLEQSLIESIEEYELQQIRQEICKYIERRRQRQVKEMKLVQKELLFMEFNERDRVRRHQELGMELEAQRLIEARLYSVAACSQLLSVTFNKLREQHFLEEASETIAADFQPWLHKYVERRMEVPSQIVNDIIQHVEQERAHATLNPGYGRMDFMYLLGEDQVGGSPSPYYDMQNQRPNTASVSPPSSSYWETSSVEESSWKE